MQISNDFSFKEHKKVKNQLKKCATIKNCSSTVMIYVTFQKKKTLRFVRVNTVIMILYFKKQNGDWLYKKIRCLYSFVYECNENDKNVQKMSKNIKNLLFFFYFPKIERREEEKKV